jgi:hypothetical protein
MTARQAVDTDEERKNRRRGPPRTASYSVSNPVSFEEERRREGVGFPTVPFRI